MLLRILLNFILVSSEGLGTFVLCFGIVFLLINTKLNLLLSAENGISVFQPFMSMTSTNKYTESFSCCCCCCCFCWCFWLALLFSWICFVRVYLIFSVLLMLGVYLLIWSLWSLLLLYLHFYFLHIIILVSLSLIIYSIKAWIKFEAKHGIYI